jgi:DNA polymerase (family 10)
METINHLLSGVFQNLASIYNYLGSSERFRAIAYSRAAKVVDGLKDDIREYAKKNLLEEIPGIGESIAEKIREFIGSGRISRFEELKKEVPYNLLGLLHVSGFGPASLRLMHKELGIQNEDDLVRAIENGSLARLKGFGQKKIENMLRGLKLFKQASGQMQLLEALEIGDRILKHLNKIHGIEKIELAGSLRRRKETIGDIDVLATCPMKYRTRLVNSFLKLEDCKTVLAAGDSKATILLKNGKQVDLRIVNRNEWGSALLHFTGSREHNIHLRTIAKDRGLRLNEYGLFRLKDDQWLGGRTEAEVYKLLGFQWIPPEMREEKGELALAAKGKIPDLVDIHDIRGDLQMHSNWSDGSMDLETLVHFVQHNFRYDYIVLTDHSKSQRIAGGLNEERLINQIAEIHFLNKKLGGEYLKTGIEVDILADGSLDLPDDLLSQLDWVCASIHSGFSGDNTERLIAACRNPFVNCLGHPGGRLIGKREPYPVDWEKVYREAAKTGTAMEINAQPDRLDLDERHARAAREAGVTLVINTDSHTQKNYYLMNLGVWVARRAWCTREDILNTKSWKEIRKFVERKRQLEVLPVF